MTRTKTNQSAGAQLRLLKTLRDSSIALSVKDIHTLTKTEYTRKGTTWIKSAIVFLYEKDYLYRRKLRKESDDRSSWHYIYRDGAIERYIEEEI